MGVKSDAATGSGLTLERGSDPALAWVDGTHVYEGTLLYSSGRHVIGCPGCEIDRLRADQERLREAGNALDRALAKIKVETESLTVDEPPEPMLHRIVALTYARTVWREVLAGVSGSPERENER